MLYSYSEYMMLCKSTTSDWSIEDKHYYMMIPTHTANVTNDKLERLKVQPLPVSTADLALSDYHLFRAVDYWLIF